MEDKGVEVELADKVGDKVADTVADEHWLMTKWNGLTQWGAKWWTHWGAKWRTG